MKRIFLAIGSLALVAMLGLSLIDAGVDAQDTATPAAGDTATGGETTEKESAKDAYLAALAANLGITTDELEAAIDATNTELDVNGHISVGGSQQEMPGKPGDSNRPSGGHDGNRGGNGPSNNGSNSGMGGGSGRSILRGVTTADAAAFLGITEDELKTELDGSDFLAVALAHGKTNDEVRAFLIEQATAQIDERLQAAADAEASADATDVPAAESTSTSISEVTEVPTAPTMTPTATA